MVALIERIKAQGNCRAIEVCFNPDNTVAEKLYASLGFMRTGRMIDGEAEMGLKQASRRDAPWRVSTMTLMNTTIVLTLTGPDRVGLVEAVTKRILERGGNVETSRMTRLGGAFAILMLATVPAMGLAELERAFEPLVAQGYKLTLSQTEGMQDEPHVGWTPYQIEVRGADQEGIIHHVAQTLAQRGITIESMDTGTSAAAMSGDPLFSMTALVLAPPSAPREAWEAALDQVGREMNVDISVKQVAG